MSPSPGAGPVPSPRPGPPVVGRRGVLGALARLDRGVYDAVARQRTPALDRPLRRLSRAADKSVLWFLTAAAMAAGGRRGRRAAACGVAAIAATSAGVNLALKPLSRRRRPRRSVTPVARHVPMPGSSSFPSGHTASAFAFTTAVASEIPAMALPLGAVAAAVAYSRVHTGVHYPGDVLVGAAIGVVAGRVVARTLGPRLAGLGHGPDHLDGHGPPAAAAGGGRA